MLDKRLGFAVEDYGNEVNQLLAKEGVSIGKASFQILKQTDQFSLLKVSYENPKRKTLAQVIAENSNDPEQLHLLLKTIILKLLQFLRQHAALNMKFNFNPEQILVNQEFSFIEDIELYPGLLFEMSDEILDQNECLKIRWNVTIEKQQQSKISMSLCEAQNKLSLAMLAYSLEDNGFIRANLFSQYLGILNSDAQRQSYLSSLEKIDCPFHKAIIENISSGYEVIESKVQKIGFNDKKKWEIDRIVQQTEAKRSQLIYIDRLVDQYLTKSKQKQLSVIKKLHQMLKEKESQDDKGDEEPELDLLDSISSVFFNQKDREKEDIKVVLDKLNQAHLRRSFNKLNKRVLVLQILGQLQAYKKLQLLLAQEE